MRTLHAVTNPNNFLRFCDELVEHTAWYTGRAVVSFSFKRRGREWLLSVKVSGWGNGNIAFISADSIGACIELYYLFLRHPPASGVRWQMAKW